MAVTNVVNESGDLLWQPNNFGTYSVEKTQLIADILSNLMNSVEITTKTVVDEDSLTNVYTKSQSDDKFVDKSTYEALVSGKVYEMLSSGSIPSSSDISSINNRLLTLYKACFGTNLSGEVVSSSSYDNSLRNLDTNYSSISSMQNRIMSVLYNYVNGSYDLTSVKVTYLSRVGDIDDLDSTVVKDRSTLAKAINSVATDVKTNTDDISKLKESTKSIKDSVSEVGESLKAISTNLGTLSGEVNLESTLASINGTISSLSDRISAIEKTLEDNSIS